MLSLGSAVMGIYVAQFLSRYLVDLLATGPLTVTFDLTATSHVLAFMVALSLATTVLFGLVPAWHATERRPVDALKAAGGIALRGRLLASVVSAASAAFGCDCASCSLPRASRRRRSVHPDSAEPTGAENWLRTSRCSSRRCR